MDYLNDLNDKMKRSNADLKLSISGFLFPNEDMPYFSSNMPTPEFGEESMRQSQTKKKEENHEVHLGKNLKFKS